MTARGGHLKNALGIVLGLLVLAQAPNLLASDCEIGQLKLRTQDQVDRFQEIVGNSTPCTRVIGELSVEPDPEGDLSDPVTSLAGLASIREVVGSFAVLGNPQLTSLQGLGAMNRIEGTLTISDNRSLASVSGLWQLARVTQRINIHSNQSLVSLAGLDRFVFSPNIRIANNPVLKDLRLLSRLNGEYPELILLIDGNPAVESLANLRGLQGTVKGLTISASHGLSDLNGLEGLTGIGQGGLTLNRNQGLENINALAGLSGTTGRLEIQLNPQLHTLDALAGLSSVSTLILAGNDALENIDGLAGLGGPIDTLLISDHLRLQNIEALSNLTSTFELVITNNQALETVDGLRNVRFAHAEVKIANNASLLHLDGLSSLERIFAWAQIVLPPVGHLRITGNPQLTDCGGVGRVLGYPNLPHSDATDGVAVAVEIGDSNGPGARTPDECLNAYAQRLEATLPEHKVAVAGSWYDPSTDGEGAMMFVAPNQILSIYFYGYDPEGEPAWWIAFADAPGDWNQPVELIAYETAGGRFNGLGPEDVTLVPWGTMTLNLWDCTTGSLELSGATGNKRLNLKRLGSVAGSPCSGGQGDDFEAGVPRSLTGAWYDPATNGQGFTLHQVSASMGVVYFFGYRDDGSHLWLLANWTTPLQFGETRTLELLEYAGGSFEPFDPADVSNTPWGSMSLRFDDCQTATATMSGTDGEQTLNLELLAGALGLPCESASGLP